MIDYQKVCEVFFGTSDIDKLKAISDKINKANRKCKISDGDIEKINKMLCNGKTTKTIAEQFGVSRQTISKYINPTLTDNYTMRIYFMHKQNVCTIIDVDFLNSKIKIINRTNNLLFRAFGADENPDWDAFMYFLESRCFPSTRGNKKELLKKIEVDNYDVFRIIEKTAGRCADDNQYINIRYQGEIS